MSGYIEKDALIGELHTQFFYDGRDRSRVYKKIQEQPTADVKEVVHGEWIETEICDGIPCDACSICGYSPFYKGEPVLVRSTYNFNYCPNCGTRMDERREDDKGKSD